MYSRRLAPLLARSSRSILLLGPRQTGKSTLIQSLLPDLTINLMHEPTFLEFARNPSELESRIRALRGPRSTVFLDEVQRLPSLLNTIQVLLDAEPRRLKFYLTGSSARRLRRGQANLLPGRVHPYSLGPLVSSELPEGAATVELLTTGCLPGIIATREASERRKTLASYAATYLREEIQAESLSRSLEGFARFIGASAEHSGKFLDVSKLAMSAQVPRPSAMRWVEVLEDTLLVRRVSSFAKSLTRRLVQHPKLFYFDVGVLNGLLQNFEPSADRIGALFEHLVLSQLFDSAASLDLPMQVSTYRTEHGAEVDFIVELGRRTWAIEVKASTRVATTDLRGLKSFKDYFGGAHQARVWTLGPTRRRLQGVDVLFWRDGLREMGL